MPYNAVKKSKGRFSKLKFLLIILILSIIGATGYYVYLAKKQTLATLESANSVTSKIVPYVNKSPSVKLTQNWSTYSNQEGSFNIKYPNSWEQPSASSRKLCPAGTFDRSVYLGPNVSSILKCGYNGQVITTSQIIVSSYIGDQRSHYELGSNGFSGVKTVNLGVSGVGGKKQTGVVNNPGTTGSTKRYSSSSAPSMTQTPVSLSTAGLMNGTFIERYIFYTDNNTYVAQYIKMQAGTSDSSDQLSNFELMVTKTLQFHS